MSATNTCAFCGSIVDDGCFRSLLFGCMCDKCKAALRPEEDDRK